MAARIASPTADLSPFLIRAGIVGSTLDRFACPHCACTDRERHLRLFLERLRLLDPIKAGSVLHMAPERRLATYIESHGFSVYVKGDLSPSHESVRPIDLQRIPFPDATFDLLIANHVLEHVDDVAAAAQEMRRVLKPGGRAICQTPFASRLSRTIEDPLHQSPDDRLFFYGQEDHVRLFGTDIARILEDAGFTGRFVPHADILPDVDAETFGINQDEPFFDFVKGEPR